jgi:hypothetical protein
LPAARGLKRFRLSPETISTSPAAYFFFVGAGDGFVGAGDGVIVAEVGTATGTAGVDCSAGVGEGSGACSGTPDCRTERVPVIIGNDRIKANSMNPAAAPIVIFDKSVCVPLGPNAVLETELENSAPASALPGCSKIVTTSTMHDRINNP